MTATQGSRECGNRRVAVVVKGWPRLSETFIAQEVLALERRGLEQVIISLRHPTDRTHHALLANIQAPVLYLPEYLHQEPGRLLTALTAARRLPGWAPAVAAWRADLIRDPTRNRVRRFGQAAVLAAELPDRVAWIHAHFLHTPASVARYAALMTGLPWSFSAHAKDIWTSRRWELQRKLHSARWGVTCTADGHAYLASLTEQPERLALVYHGLDFSRFPGPPPERPPRDGRDRYDPVRLLSVGRAVEKKGFDIALTALARLPAALSWRWVHIGGGPLLPALRARAEQQGLADRIEWLGAQAQDVVIRCYAEADLFMLPSRRARDGDRDGLPNVLMEAQAMGLACLATRTAGIPELIIDGQTGILVPPDDADALAVALGDLIATPGRRRNLAAAGVLRVRRDFACEPGIDHLAQCFDDFIAGDAPAQPESATRHRAPVAP
ncbi:MAG: glycosyltransferase [Azospirillaceae bacterium]|nr:glycosyltransferase [Azospirillaceae bacterium]